MKSTITVGEDAETDTVDKFKGTRRGNDVKISYKLNEPAKVTYKLKGRSGRTVKRPRREAGRYSFTAQEPQGGRVPGNAHRGGRLRQEGHAEELLRRSLRDDRRGCVAS